jgi:hypothetical protein
MTKLREASGVAFKPKINRLYYQIAHIGGFADQTAAAIPIYRTGRPTARKI